MHRNLNTLFLSVLDRGVRIQCHEPEIVPLLWTNFAAMRSTQQRADLSYIVGRRQGTSSFFLKNHNGKCKDGASDGEFLYLFESDLRMKMQRIRRDLYFIHAAALEIAGKAVLLIGQSKSGKSTTTCGLLQHGFSYLSDELAPIDPDTLEVYSYPRALWLRRELQDMRLSPSQKIQTSWMLCVPTETFPNGVGKTCTPLRAVYFLRYSSEAQHPSLRKVRKTEATARILSQTLNPGAHLHNGLEAAATIAEKVLCFDLTAAGLLETCNLVKSSVAELS
jgi:hypothetical protein